MLDDIFQLLELANHLEERRETRLEAATKYYEAVYLMKRYVQRIPESTSESNARQLLLGKVAHYEARAATLMEDASSTSSSSLAETTTTTTAIHPLSPIDKETFFHAESSVVPLPPPTHFPSSSSEVAEGALSSSSSLGAATGSSPFGAPSDDLTVHVGRANGKLAQALDADEAGQTAHALQAYLEAAALYLQALQQLDGSTGGGADNNNNTDDSRKVVADVLKRRLQSTLDRIEVLKALPQRPSNPSSTGQQQHRSRAAPSTSIPTATNNNHSRTTNNHSPARPGSAAATTAPTSALSSEEIAVLKRSSLISSGLFLPWSDDDARALAQSAKNATTSSGSSAPPLFRDPRGFLPLSPKQKARFHQWARPSEIVRVRQRAGLTRKVQAVELVRHITPYTIKQQFVTDCSFVAGLCICAAYERRFRKRLVSALLHPQDENGNPILSPEGKYLVRLWLNGVARSVVIDDCLPIDKLGNLLCSHSSHAANSSYLELWVCLIEKAYMKLCGGYDFPGSNSGVDLFSLTGWIPERVLLPSDPTHVRDFETPTDRAWERIASASSYGDCLITVSTERPPATKGSEASDETVLSETGLVTGHAYAVLSVLQTRNGTRLLQVKNPWGHQGWKGRYASSDSASWGDPAFCAEVGYDPRQARLRDDGVFWICWEDVLQHFQNFHLSWNPALFRYVARSHGLWKREQGPSDDTFNVGENPQYHLSLSERAVKGKATVWILVSRHVDKQEQEGSEARDFLTVHIHRGTARGERVWYAGRRGDCILTGAYTNNPHVLVRYDVAGPQDTHLSLVLSQYQKRQDLGYTLSCFCTEDFALGPSVPDLPHRIALQSAWTPGRCGGPLGTPQCHRNPTFAVSVPETAAAASGCPGPKVQIRLTVPPTVAVNAYMVPVSKWGDAFPQWSPSWPPAAVVDSGQYRHGFVATVPARIPPGPYVLLVSGYTPGVTGPLELVVASTSDTIQVKELP